MKIRADRREIEFRPQPEADRIASEACARISEDQIRLAKALRTMWSTAAYVQENCASVGEYVLRRGLSPFQGTDLLYVGIAIATFDWVEPRLRDGSAAIHCVSLLGRVCALAHEDAFEDDDEWETWVRFLPYRKLRALVHRRVEEVKQRTKDLHRFTTHVTRQALEDFAEARVLASRKEGRALTKGETFAFVSRDFLERHDPTLRKAGPRRIGDTSAPTCRTVPAETLRACEEVYGDRCWVPGCQHRIFLEHVHIKPNREGGSQEPANVGRGCHTHHVLFDAGKMWIIGRNERGLPIFETSDGQILHPDYPGARLLKSASQPEVEGTSPDPAGDPSAGRSGGASAVQDRPWPSGDRVRRRVPARVRERILRRGMASHAGRRVRFEVGASHLRGPPRASSP